MQRLGNHNTNCEEAAKRTCVCTGCCGARHGWSGWLQVSTNTDLLGQQAEIARQRWIAEKQHYKKTSRRKPRLAYKGACVDLARIDLLKWMADDNGTIQNGRSRSSEIGAPLVDQVREVGQLLPEQVLTEITKSCGGQLTQAIGKELANHFWCDVLAHLARVLSPAEKLMGRAPVKALEREITGSRAEVSKTASLLDNGLTRTAVTALWGQLQRLVTSALLGNFSDVPDVLRILTLLICKSPEQHRAVVVHCLEPLKKRLLSTTREELAVVFHDWIPDVALQRDGE
jgi:hypothetical protein